MVERIAERNRRNTSRASGKSTDAKTARAKTETAFRTIGEVAEQLNLPQHVLRFWEKKFHQIRPVKRSGGRRYYRAEDIALLVEIRGLLHDQGYTIRGVQKLLREGGLAKAVKARAKAEPKAAMEKPAAAKAADTRQIGMPFELLNDMGQMKQAMKNCLKDLEAIHADIVARQMR
ncbi:MAG TPA: MerR family transcriptional regulator [Ferrovibrio sp.]|uniref:MerR family transcriptional regulator n=1 Tax=Ferrovibrio sp. TaxID=1917215 RepID=UPI002ED6A210